MVLVLSSISLLSQNKNTKIADKLFDRFEYVKAVQGYLSLVQRGEADTYVYKQLGDCYYFMNKTVDAEKWYSKVMTSNDIENIYLYRYAQVLKSNKKYEEANKQMMLFSSKLPTDNRGIAFDKEPDYLSRLNSIDDAFEIQKIEINSDHSDFGGVLYKNTLYFVSSRNLSNTIYGWNNEPFLDIYQSNYDNDGKFSAPILVEELNTKYNEGPVTITKDGNTVYFSTESFNDNLIDKNKVKKLNYGQVNIFKATNVDGKWKSVTPLSINSKNYSTSNPSIDSDGNYLYFSSNMPGSIGGMDIWKVKINSDGTCGEPENLGDKVNTEDDESFPYITDKNILYFSSKGLVGFGGYDIFSIDLNSADSVSENLGKPVNSEKDDFAFSFNTEKNVGFLSSNREGIDNIYSAKPIYNGKIIVSVKNKKDGLVMPGLEILIQDENKTFLDTKLTNEKGELSYRVEPNMSYVVEVHKDGFETKKINVPAIKKGTVFLDVLLESIDVVVNGGENIILNPIYFDFNKSSITSKAAKEIDKLVYIMSQNYKINIFVKSHTDSRGPDEYNLNLSNRRAKETVKYVVSKGIDSDRISGKGFGESELKVNCGDNCTEGDHALNRRSEFIIVK